MDIIRAQEMTRDTHESFHNQVSGVQDAECSWGHCPVLYQWVCVQQVPGFFLPVVHLSNTGHHGQTSLCPRVLSAFWLCRSLTLCLPLSVCLSLSLSFCLSSLNLSVFVSLFDSSCLFVCLSFCVSASLSSVSRFVSLCLPLSCSLSLPLSLSPICVLFSLCVCLSVYLSVCLSPPPPPPPTRLGVATRDVQVCDQRASVCLSVCLPPPPPPPTRLGVATRDVPVCDQRAKCTCCSWREHPTGLQSLRITLDAASSTTPNSASKTERRSKALWSSLCAPVGFCGRGNRTRDGSVMERTEQRQEIL